MKIPRPSAGVLTIAQVATPRFDWKQLTRTRTIILLALLLGSCSKAADPQAREMELRYLRCVMPESLLEFAHVEVPGLENIAIVGEGDGQHLGLHVVPGQKKLHGGIRAEISIDFPFQQGDTVRYAWRFMMPEGTKTDAPENRWWIIGQWHDQPDESRGETWDDFPSNSPPLLLGFGGFRGKLVTGISYNPTQSQKSDPVVIEPGKWHSVALEIRWSQKADGRASFYFDDLSKPAAVLDGPNMHNAYQHYLKLGIYRHPDIAIANSIFIDDITIIKLGEP